MLAFLIVTGFHLDSTSVFRAIRSQIKPAVTLKGIDAPVAIHDYEVLSEVAHAILVLFNVSNSLVINCAILYALRLEKTPINKEVEKSETNYATELVGSNLFLSLKLLSALSALVKCNLLGCLVFVAFYFHGLLLKG